MWKALVPLILIVCGLANAAAATSFAEVNAAFGVQLLQDDSLWDDDASGLARRLALPAESETKEASSFRSYPPAGAKVLGVRPYSVSLNAKLGRPAQLSFVFTNSGDFGNLFEIQDDLKVAVGKAKTDLRKQEREALTAFPAALKSDAATLQSSLTKLFGAPEATRESGGRAVSEKVQRWTWNSHVFALATKDDQYVAIRIEPVAEAEGARRLKDSVVRQRLKQSVERRPNGDVVVTGIPMVDQGPKGFCVAATLDRSLKFLGIPADMYVLAVAGQTGMGGGASVDRMLAATADFVRSYGCRFEKAGASVKLSNVARYIDDGMPLMWRMHVVEKVDKSVSERSVQRRQSSDVKKWKAVLKEWKKQVGRVRPDPESGHVCMIIGYNKETEELAISDSWGPEYAERWISLEEAEMISRGELFVVSW